MKKLLTILCLISFTLPAMSNDCDCFAPMPNNCPCSENQEYILREEHMFCTKKAPSNKVLITNLQNIICQGNVFEIQFNCKFWSDKSCAGDKVNFLVPESIYTQEGTLLIPNGSKVVATVIKIEKQKVFNKNARVYLKFDCIALPDGSAITLNAKPFTKDGALKENGWMTAGKILGSAVGLGVIGAGAGVGFAFIPNPEKIGTGLAIGIPVGVTVGLITGLVTPGLKYHAKKCEKIKIILCDELYIPKIECEE